MTPAINRVVIINHDCVESGGAAGIAIQSALLLAGHGLRVTFITGDAGQNARLTEAGVDIAAFGGKTLLQAERRRAAINGLYDRQARAFLKDWITTHDQPGTIYHLHNWHKILSPSVFPALRAVEDRLLLTAHDYFLVCPNGGYSNFPKNEPCHLRPLTPQCLACNCDKRHYAHKLWRVARQVMRQQLFALSQTPATIVAVHDGMVGPLVRGGISRRQIRVLHNPVTPWLTERVEAEKNHTVMFVGRMELDKGPDVLAHAARLADVPCTLVGEGPLRSSLTREFPRMHFPGRLDKAAIGKVVANARVLVMPTRTRETFGIVAAEALMCGIPVIASELAPISEDIVRKGWGFACKPGDSHGLAQRIAQLSKDDAIIARMSRRAFAEARMLAPSADAYGQSLIDLYREKLRLGASVEPSPESGEPSGLEQAQCLPS